MSTVPDVAATAKPTPYEAAQRALEAGRPAGEIQHLLATEHGLGPEEVQVLLQALRGDYPKALPEIQVDLSVNPLSQSFALSDLGFAGEPRTVALYRAALGAALAVAGVLVWAGLTSEFANNSDASPRLRENLGTLVLWVTLVPAVVNIARGAWVYWQALEFRPRR
jgi:hypothetical protein